MDTPYYNLIPPLAQSEDFEPMSPGGSDDSGVQDEQPQRPLGPQRPPRSIDQPCTSSKLPKHSYINLGHPARHVSRSPTSVTSDDPPSLPKRQPYLVNPRSPALTVRSSSGTSSARSSLLSRQQQRSRGICKCKTTTSGKFCCFVFTKIFLWPQQGVRCAYYPKRQLLK